VLKDNYNLLWLIPLHFPAGLWLVLARHRPVFLNWYLWFAFLSAILFVCFSVLLPQKFNPAVFPLLILLGWRCGLELFPISKRHSCPLPEWR
jgi:CHASE2 domain-containing sensor protein